MKSEHEGLTVDALWKGGLIQGSRKGQSFLDLIFYHSPEKDLLTWIFTYQ